MSDGIAAEERHPVARAGRERSSQASKQASVTTQAVTKRRQKSVEWVWASLTDRGFGGRGRFAPRVSAIRARASEETRERRHRGDNPT
jgi:hypothetical protein